MGLCGFTSGWRLPTVDELMTIIRRNPPISAGPAVDAMYFPNLSTNAGGVWTSEPASNVSWQAWTVWFNNGFFGIGYTKSDGAGVRLVHDGM
jgi:hypothetical protein